MSHVLTLVASAGNLSIAHLEKLEKFVEGHGIGLAGKPAWLDRHIAADMPVQNTVTIEQMKALRALFAEDEIDILCVATEHRKKKLLLADMDSTIVAAETLDELAGKAGIKDRIAAITARAMNGELDFKAALRERVGLLSGLPLSALRETLDETEFCEGAEHLIRTMRESGAICVLVSGGFTFFTGAIAQKAGFHHHHGNTLDDDGAMLLGTVSGDILDKDSKLSYLKSYTQELGLDLNQTLAIGDGANDLPMLAAAGLGIGYRPKPILAETLLNILRFADLRGVLYAQGFKNIC
jgi:phosphoserine phosphatase